MLTTIAVFDVDKITHTEKVTVQKQKKQTKYKPSPEGEVWLLFTAEVP